MALQLAIDDCGIEEFCDVLRCDQLGEGMRYVVTPNVDHIIRFCDEPEFRRLYEAASHVLLDSRFLARLLPLYRQWQRPPRVCTGSDLTAAIFSKLLRPEDRVVLIGGIESQAAALRLKFGLHNLQHSNPKMGFIDDPGATEFCLQFIEGASPFRFCFLALGSPQQERLAFALKQRGRTQGVVLCVGASINFLTGTERRAPTWLQRWGLEWLYRLARSPRRLGRRYLLRGPRIFWLLSQIELRPKQIAP